MCHRPLQVLRVRRHDKRLQLASATAARALSQRPGDRVERRTNQPVYRFALGIEENVQANELWLLHCSAGTDAALIVEQFFPAREANRKLLELPMSNECKDVQPKE